MADTALRWKLYLQICRGLEAIHAEGIIHMDLKPENGPLSCLCAQHDRPVFLLICVCTTPSLARGCSTVLLTEHKDARIADLGLATVVEDGTDLQTHIGGTEGYNAPEVGTRNFSNKVDIYSCAIMFFEMAVGRGKAWRFERRDIRTPEPRPRNVGVVNNHAEDQIDRAAHGYGTD